MNKKVKDKKGSKFLFDKEFSKMSDTHYIIVGNSGHGISQIGEILKHLKTRKS